MCRTNAVNAPHNQRVHFSLRDLRTAKGLTMRQLAHVLDISKSLYHAIECGKRKPTADVVFVLAAIYGTSMDFIYHAFYRQHVIWNFPEGDLQYAMRAAKAYDVQYLTERTAPHAPPKLPEAIILDDAAGTDGGAGRLPDVVFKPYGLDR